MDFDALGLQIRRYRRRKNLTQAELAEMIGVSTSFIGHIERGTRVLSLETFVQLCTALNTDPNSLLSMEGDGGFLPDSLTDEQKEQLQMLLQYASQLVREL